MELNMGYETFISKKCWKAACHNYHLICFFHQYPSANNLKFRFHWHWKWVWKGHDTPGTPPSTLPPSYAIQPHVWGPSMASCCGVMAWSRSLKELKTGLDELEEICWEKSLPLKPMLVMVGWAGNDVWGKSGVQRCALDPPGKIQQNPSWPRGLGQLVQTSTCWSWLTSDAVWSFEECRSTERWHLDALKRWCRGLCQTWRSLCLILILYHIGSMYDRLL